MFTDTASECDIDINLDDAGEKVDAEIISNSCKNYDACTQSLNGLRKI